MINLHLYTVIYIDNNYRYVIFFFTLYITFIRVKSLEL